MASFVRKIGFMKHFTVFNLEQFNGVEIEDESEIKTIEQIASNCGALFASNSTLPYFDADTDTIHATSIKRSILPVLIEWTGGTSRLERSLVYEEEELVQTIGAAFLTKSVKDEVEIKPDIVEKWLERLDENPNFLYKSASAAEKAFSLISENVKIAS